MSGQEPRELNLYRPGDLAPISGIYRVIHLTRHRGPHLAIIIRGEELPLCRNCQGDVEFEVVQTASHVTHDWDFTAPSGLSISHRAPDEFANLRTDPRHPIAMQLAVDRPEKKRELRGEIADISAGGLCAFLEDKLEATDALVNLRIKVPGADDPLVLGGLMRYRFGNRHGFLFTDLDTNARELVRSLLQSARRSS